ncbi:MAG: C2 family cysteine protease [Chitinophagaceae bacterium]
MKTRSIWLMLLPAVFLGACSKGDNDATSTSVDTTTTSSSSSADSSISDLMQYATGSTYTVSTPMGTHYANKHETTTDDIEWLNDPDNEPSVPASVSGLVLKSFSVTLYPFGTPSPADVNQHAIGDCDLLAPLASLAYIYPSFVKKLITDNGDGTYTVAMYDPQGNAITVVVSSKFLASTDGSLEAGSGKNSVANWVTVLEKAVMKYNMIYEVDTDIGGIGSEFVAPLFTGNGNSFAFSPGTLSTLDLQRAVDVSLAKGFLVIGGFNKVFSVGNYSTVTGHGYTLMYSTDNTALFAMRNPWGTMPGSSDGSEDGVLPIPDDDVMAATIDLRIIYSGAAGSTGTTTPYRPPSF